MRALGIKALVFLTVVLSSFVAIPVALVRSGVSVVEDVLTIVATVR